MSQTNEMAVTTQLQEQRACLAQFMDDNPSTFPAPVDGGTWADFVHRGVSPQGRDSQVLDRALGMLVGTIRSAQQSLDGSRSLAEVMAVAQPDMATYPPDPAVMEQEADETDPAERAAYAQAMTIYKECAENGIIERDALLRHIEEAFDKLPGSSPLMRSLIDASKRMVCIDLERVLAHPGATEARA